MVAQIILLCLIAVGLIQSLYRDINGREAQEPRGFNGVMTTLIATTLILVLYYYAGALSHILN